MFINPQSPKIQFCPVGLKLQHPAVFRKLLSLWKLMICGGVFRSLHRNHIISCILYIPSWPIFNMKNNTFNRTIFSVFLNVAQFPSPSSSLCPFRLGMKRRTGGTTRTAQTKSWKTWRTCCRTGPSPPLLHPSLVSSLLSTVMQLCEMSVKWNVTECL